MINKKSYITSIVRDLPGFHIINKLRKTMIYRKINLIAPPPPHSVFSNISIETINRCNCNCAFCPVNKNADTREYKKMDTSLFDKIVKELQGLNFKGHLCLSLNNEPFLDERIEVFAEKLRLALPDITIRIYTNGTLLTLDRFKKIIPYIDSMILDNYNDKLKLNSTTKVIHEYCKNHPSLDKKVRIDLIKINAVRHTRGGYSPNNTAKETLPLPCFAPYTQLNIRPDGKVSLCCIDALGKHTLGDITKQTIMEVWNSKEFMYVREQLRNSRREELDVCKYCDRYPNLLEN